MIDHATRDRQAKICRILDRRAKKNRDLFTAAGLILAALLGRYVKEVK